MAYDIDDLHSPYFMGTIAGADTVFVALTVDAPKAKILSTLASILPEELLTKRYDAHMREKSPDNYD